MSGLNRSTAGTFDTRFESSTERPLTKTTGDSSSVSCTPRSSSERARISAVIHPAVPPPTMTTRRRPGSGAVSRLVPGP